MPAPIFIHAESRSGGTLLATIFDAHPDVAMSYELYALLLEPLREIDCSKLGKDPVKALLEILRKRRSSTKRPLVPFRIFLDRAKRSGIDYEQASKLIAAYIQEGGDFYSFESRYRLVERFARTKMFKEKKTRWGVKILARYSALRRLYPDACFFHLLRDGRDIASSKLNVGNFNQTVETIAATWVSGVRSFDNWCAQDDKSFWVKYEDLVRSPEEVLRDLMDKAGLPWSRRAMDFYKLDLTIHKSPAGHLSREQIKRKINLNSVGRWKRDLTAAQVNAFHKIAGETLERFGYAR